MKGESIYFTLQSSAKLLFAFFPLLALCHPPVYLPHPSLFLFNSISQVWSVEKSVFLFPLDPLTGARVFWLEMDQCVSSALRRKHFKVLWSLGKHTQAPLHTETHTIALSMILYNAKTNLSGGIIILWHLTNWITGKWGLRLLTGRHCAISIFMTSRRR